MKSGRNLSVGLPLNTSHRITSLSLSFFFWIFFNFHLQYLFSPMYFIYILIFVGNLWEFFEATEEGNSYRKHLHLLLLDVWRHFPSRIIHLNTEEDWGQKLAENIFRPQCVRYHLWSQCNLHIFHFHQIQSCDKWIFFHPSCGVFFFPKSLFQ